MFELDSRSAVRVRLMLVERRDIIAEDWAREVLLRDGLESFSGASVRVLNGGGTPTVSRVRP